MKFLHNNFFNEAQWTVILNLKCLNKYEFEKR